MSAIGELALLVNDDFSTPLNEQINGLVGLRASDNIYTSQEMGELVYEDGRNMPLVSPTYFLPFVLPKKIIANTEGSINLKAYAGATYSSNNLSGIYGYSYIEIFQNNNIIYKSDTLPQIPNYGTNYGGVNNVLVNKGDVFTLVVYLGVSANNPSSGSVTVDTANGVLTILGDAVLRVPNGFSVREGE